MTGISDAHCLNPKNFQILAWMDMDYFFQETVTTASTWHSEGATKCIKVKKLTTICYRVPSCAEDLVDVRNFACSSFVTWSTHKNFLCRCASLITYFSRTTHNGTPETGVWCNKKLKRTHTIPASVK